MTATPEGVTYGGYLRLDRVLGAQEPLSDLHDEMLFIVMHQTMELWIKQAIHELGEAQRLIRADRLVEAYKNLARVSRIQSVMTASWDVLATLTPIDFGRFRHVLGTSSGFQSSGFRELEFRLGIKHPAYLQHAQPDERPALERALAEPSLRDDAEAALERAGLCGPEGWEAVYRDPERWWDLYQLAEKLVDIDDALATWRHKHLVTIQRIIGGKTGTGGSAGAAYLASTLPKRAFPDLWSLRTRL